jgi:hypothetical protein
MTQTTVNRQLTLLVQGVLKKYEIDNLQLEIDIIASVHRLFSEGGKDPAKMVKIREEILSSMLAGAAKENVVVEMESRVKVSMNLETGGQARYEDMLRFLVKKDGEGQPVERYAQWCKENPYEAPKSFQIAIRPNLLMETWSMAFPERKEYVAQPTGTGFYA